MAEYINLRVTAETGFSEVEIKVDTATGDRHEANALDALNRAYAEARRRIEATA